MLLTSTTAHKLWEKIHERAENTLHQLQKKWNKSGGICGRIMERSAWRNRNMSNDANITKGRTDIIIEYTGIASCRRSCRILAYVR